MRSGRLLLVVLAVTLTVGAASVVRADDKKADAAHKDDGHAPKKGDVAHAGGHETPDPFKQALDLTIWTMVVFLLLLFILSQFAWKPMLQGLKAREESIQSALDEAKKAQEEATKLRAEMAAEMAKANDMVRAKIDEAKRDAQHTADELIKKAREEIQAERDRTRRDLETAKDQALQELWSQSAQLATLISAKAIRRNINEDDHRRLVDEALSELLKSGQEEVLRDGGHSIMNSEKIVKEAKAFHADVTAQRIAAVYAESLIDVAAEKHELDDILGQLNDLVQEVFAADPSVEEYLGSRAVSRDNKAKTIRDTFGHRASETFLNFLLVLNEHERLELLRAIRVEFQSLYNHRTGKVRVRVESAAALPEDQQERLKGEIRKALDREPLLELSVDPTLLGGVVIRVGNWLFDGSVKSRLEQIRNQIIERSSHEIQRRRDQFSSDSGN